MARLERRGLQGAVELDTRVEALRRELRGLDATRAGLEGKDAHRFYYQAFFEKYEVRGVDLLDRVVQDWYVFAEYLVNYDDGHVRRLALTHPIENGKITGTFGYGRDEKKGN